MSIISYINLVGSLGRRSNDSRQKKRGVHKTLESYREGWGHQFLVVVSHFAAWFCSSLTEEGGQFYYHKEGGGHDLL